ncbi:MAG: nicotinate (nicotinamide) nucleotide adenylyltransferase [Sulfuricurvum sp.]|nr:nicotinate (nicotinamide) nucleotide adenylyltransferase [Sulfuricurvum sp.]MDD5387105.1 nicotinate (nicotinamide) nucleotide adenylyltransferase [Sulfuricurvum sp.]
MNIALYGGSFDPPHIGHVRVALKALEVLEIDKLIIVPAFKNPFKPSASVNGTQRLQWLKQIFQAYPKIEISSFEIDQKRSVTTIETVRHYAKIYNKLYLIIGADNLATLDKWHEVDTLRTMVTLVIATRDGIPIPNEMITLSVNESVNSTDFRSSFGSLGLDEKIENDITHYYKEHYEPTN